MGLERFSDTDLESELERRRKGPEPKPEVLKKPNFTKLIECAEGCLKVSCERNWDDEDNAQYIYEAAMQCIYGEGYFDWHRKRFP